MTTRRLPALILALTSFAFLVWGVVLVISPGGATVLEWSQLGVSAALLGFGLVSLREEHPQRATVIRWLLTGFAVFGAVVVIGLAADNSSSRTWVRLGWAALLLGSLACLIAWWTAPRADRRIVTVGGVVAVVLIAGGAVITANCDRSLQRSWCDPLYEQEARVAGSVEVAGTVQRVGRAGGDTGAALVSYLIDGDDIRSVTEAPAGFVYEERPLQSTEVERGRFTSAGGRDSNCWIDVKLEVIPQGNLETVTVRCEAE